MSSHTPHHSNLPNEDEVALGDVDAERRALLVNATTAFGLAGAACVALPFIQTMNPSRSVKAMATIDVALGEIPEGEAKTFLWQGKPVFVWHRNAAQIAEIHRRIGINHSQQIAAGCNRQR